MKTRKTSRTRAALAIDPSLYEVEDGKDAYVQLGRLRQLAKLAQRWWSFHGIPTTVEIESAKRYAKLWDKFADHSDPFDFAELLREFKELGVPRPSGYADVFHARFKSPRIPWSINAQLAPAFSGGWQSALKVGVHSGVYHKYDLRSAYLWAGSLGLPDTKTYRRTLTISPDNPGVYRIELAHPVDGAPHPFNRARQCLASSEEIETYSLPVKRVISGVTWTRDLDPTQMLNDVRAVSTWKQAGRSYWGRWSQSERVECHAGGRSWCLPNFAANIPWAHLIVSRVKNKLWNYSTDAVHVYVDSVITPHEIPTGENIGDWKYEGSYENGVIIRGPGQYGDPHAMRLDRMAGVPKGSKLRDIMAEKNLELLAE